MYLVLVARYAHLQRKQMQALALGNSRRISQQTRIELEYNDMRRSGMAQQDSQTRRFPTFENESVQGVRLQDKVASQLFEDSINGQELPINPTRRGDRHVSGGVA